jgi:hypothetical protein
MASHVADTADQAVSCQLQHWCDQIAAQKSTPTFCNQMPISYVNSSQEMVPILCKGLETQWQEGTDGTPIMEIASILRRWDPYYYVSDPGLLRMRVCTCGVALSSTALHVPSCAPLPVPPCFSLVEPCKTQAILLQLLLLEDRLVVGLSELGLWTNMPRCILVLLTDYGWRLSDNR